MIKVLQNWHSITKLTKLKAELCAPQHDLALQNYKQRCAFLNIPYSFSCLFDTVIFYWTSKCIIPVFFILFIYFFCKNLPDVVHFS